MLQRTPTRPMMAPDRFRARCLAAGIDELKPKVVGGPASQPVQRGDTIQVPIDAGGVVFCRRVQRTPLVTTVYSNGS
jgi:hypothetical protein